MIKPITPNSRLALAVLLSATATAALASSHREAPMIALMPALDGTDLYLFRSYENGREDYVTLIANYYPLQEPGAGPNYYDLETDAVYEIHIDNDGDSVEDITFSFDFDTVLNGITVPVGGRNVAIPLINAGPLGPMAEDTEAVNSRQTYTVDLIIGDRRTGGLVQLMNADSGETSFRKPLDNIGAKSIPDYVSYAEDHIYHVELPGCTADGRMFVGQRQEGFAVNVGPLFDLVNLNPLGPVDAVENPLAGKNVTSLALELPISCLTTASDPVIGAWTTSSMDNGQGDLLQVSRLGFPLVNEVVIGLPDKDMFNASEPMNDDQFSIYAKNPTLPFLLELLFSSAGAVAPTNFPRTDVVVAITGVPGLNMPAAMASGGVVRSDMLRLNTDIDVTPVASQDNLGVLGGDMGGFPNGRRPGDDVVDIALRVMMGALNTDVTQAPNNMAPFTDQTTLHAADFMQEFPYLNPPLPGAGSNL